VNQRRTDALKVAVAPVLLDGERVELASAAMVGNLSTARVVAQGLATFTVPKRLFVALTDQRLLFLEPSAISGRPTSKIVVQLPRPALACTGTRIRMMMFMLPTLIADLAIIGSQAGLSLTFPVAYRADGQQIAAALTTSSPVPPDRGSGVGHGQGGALARGAIPAGPGTAGRSSPGRVIKAVIGAVLTVAFVAGGVGEVTIGNAGGAVLSFVLAVVSAGYAVLAWTFRWRWLAGPRPGKRPG